MPTNTLERRELAVPKGKPPSQEGHDRPERQVNIRMTGALYARIEACARESELDVANFLRSFIKEFLPNIEDRLEERKRRERRGGQS